MLMIMIIKYWNQWRNVGHVRPPAGAPVAHLAPREAVLLNVSLKIKSRKNSENDGKNLKKMYISSLKRVLLLVLQLSFSKNVPYFRAILRTPETAPPCSAGSAGPIVTPLMSLTTPTTTVFKSYIRHMSL